MFIARAPFRYQKFDEYMGLIVSEQIAAAIVLNIFNLAVDGMGIIAIVCYINENHIPTTNNMLAPKDCPVITMMETDTYKSILPMFRRIRRKCYNLMKR